MQHLAAKLPLGEPAGDEKRLLKGEFGLGDAYPSLDWLRS